MYVKSVARFIKPRPILNPRLPTPNSQGMSFEVCVASAETLTSYTAEPLLNVWPSRRGSTPWELGVGSWEFTAATAPYSRLLHKTPTGQPLV